MSETQAEDDDPAVGGRRAVGADLIIPVASGAFAVYYLYTIWGLPWEATAAGIGITSAMAILLVILGVRFIGELRRGEGDLGLGSLVHPTSALAQRAGLLAAGLAFIYLMPWLGFTLGLFVFLMVAIMLLSGLAHVRKAVIISLAVSLGGYLLFIVFVRARFPRGPFENLISYFT